MRVMFYACYCICVLEYTTFIKYVMKVRCACPFRDCGLLIDLDDDTPECVGCEAKVTHSCANRQMLDSRDNGKKKQTLCVTCASRGYIYVIIYIICMHMYI